MVTCASRSGGGASIDPRTSSLIGIRILSKGEQGDSQEWHAVLEDGRSELCQHWCGAVCRGRVASLIRRPLRPWIDDCPHSRAVRESLARTIYTDEQLEALREMSKRVINPTARWTMKPRAKLGHRQRNFTLEAVTSGESLRFRLYERQSLTELQSFSCGIIYLPVDAPPLTLARYNGGSHIHGDIRFSPHIHRTTSEAIAAGRKPDSAATETDRYNSREGALACLVEDFNVSGLYAIPQIGLLS